MKRIKFWVKKLINAIEGKPCFICEYSKDSSKISYTLIYEDNNFIAFLDKYPTSKGYTLVSPKKHIQDITQLTPEEYLKMQKIIHNVSNAIKKAFSPNRICLFQLGGVAPHLHFHIVPIYGTLTEQVLDIIKKKSILEFSEKENTLIANKIRKNMKWSKSLFKSSNSLVIK